MKHYTLWRVILVFCSFMFVDCNCSESLNRASLEPPQIDICFVPKPGEPELCYLDLKSNRTQESCTDTGECALPELNADLGTIAVNGALEFPIRVVNVGETPLELYNIGQAPGSSSRFRLSPTPENSPSDIYRIIDPGEEFQFQAQLSGGSCGIQNARWVITSNDAAITRGSSISQRSVQPDSPLYLNLTGMVSGPCLCPLTNATLAFGGVIVGESETKRFSFESCGDEPLVVNDATIGQDPSNVFSVSDLIVPDNNTLVPGEQGHIDISYLPTQIAPPSDAGQAWLATNAPTSQPHFPILLIGDGLTRPACKLGALPSTTSFGTVGSPVTRNFKIFNEGEIACRLYDLQRSGGSPEFTINGTPLASEMTLEPNDNIEIQITYLPVDDSFDQATFTAYADDAYQIETTAQIEVSGNPPGGEGCVLDVQPDYGDFGDISLGQTTNITFNIGNIGTSSGGIAGFFGDNCQLNEVILLSGSPDFRLGDIGALTDIIGIPPGGMLDTSLTVYFEPQSEGIKTGTLRILSNDINGAVRDIPLWGNALGAKLCVNVEGQTPATLSCGATQPCDTLNFGEIATSDTSTQPITLTNCGAGELVIRGIEMDPASHPQFIKTGPSADLLPITLMPNQSTVVPIRYSPTESSGDFGAITILSNASTAPQARIDLRGNFTGDCEQIIRCSPEFTNFGTVESGTEQVKTITCTNFGQEDITIGDIISDGASQIELLTPNYGTLQPGESVSLQPSCTPTGAGALESTLSVLSNACDRSPFTLELQCNGIASDPPDCIGSDVYNPIEKWRWTSSPSYPGYDDVWVTPIVINLTDDNEDGVIDVLDTPDVIFTAIQSSIEFGPGGQNGGQEAFCHANDARPAIVVAVSGDNGRELWAWGTPPTSGPADPSAKMMDSKAQLAAGDIDADGYPEIIGVRYTYIPPPECEPTDFECCIRGKFAYGSLIALEHDGQFKWQSELWHLPQTTIENAGAPSLGDMNGDGFPEIAFGNAVFDHRGNLVFEGITTSSAANGNGQGGAGHGPISLFVDLDGNGTNELVAGRTAFNAQGQILWDRQDIQDGLSTVANLDSDPDPEIIILTGANDLYVLEHTGSTKYGPMHIESGNVDENGQEEGFISTNPAVGDFDGDGFPEIAIAATNQVHVFEHDLTPKWSNPISDQTGASGPTSFDFEGDGRAEVVYADEGNVYIWNGLDGSEKYRASRGSRTIFDNPVIVDVDNDNHAEIIVSMESPAGNLGMHGVIAYGNDKDNWVATRRIWNQHGYHISNVSESGVIPAYEGRGWLEHNVYRSNVIRCE